MIPNRNIDQQMTDPYSIIEGGLFRKVQMKLGVENHQGLLALAGLCFAWVPLVILTTIDGTVYAGVDLPFLNDVAMHARILIALPILILIRNVINIKTTAVIRYIAESLLDDEERQKFLSVKLPKMRKLACSSLTEGVILLIVLASVLSLIQSGAYGGLQGSATSWKFVGLPADNIISLAGKWAAYISVPFFQFILLQWLWRYTVWMMLLLHLSRLPLKLRPTHADRSGGLGIIILAQRSFSYIFVAGSLVISGQLIVFIMNSPDNMLMIQRVVIGYIILCLMLLILPLIFFIGKLVRTKQLGLLHLSELGIDISKTFESDWLNKKPIEERIEKRQVDPSLAYDYSSMYDLLQQLRVVPITTLDVIGIVLSLALPFLPVLFVYYSASEVLSKIIGLLM